MESLQVLFWSMAGGVVSLIGGLLLIKAAKVRESVIRYALPFGAGALLAAAFLGLFPEAVEGMVHDLGETAVVSVSLLALGGFLAFFILERLLGWFHHHHHDDAHGHKDKTHQWLVVIGDTVHNAIDGVAIGAAFLINPGVGIATSLATAAHEIPQEIGDFGILLSKGMKPRRVVLVNVLSALATVVMALLTFWLGSIYALDPTPLIALAAGFFIYIAASDIIPDIHERPRREGNRQTVMLLLGVALIGTLMLSMPHEHGDGDHHEELRSDDSYHIPPSERYCPGPHCPPEMALPNV